eukprot:Gb_15822 [translate_table: standard]
MERQHGHRIYPLTGLQIGDLQSYVSRLYLYLTCESSKVFILVDNGPWLLDNHYSPAQLWQLMVTKSRMSPFANTRSRLEDEDIGNKVQGKQEAQAADQRDRLPKWFSVIDAARWQHKALAPVKELHHTLHGCVVFEVAWADVRGINYINELQTDTCMALESKSMTKKEFDSIEQALDCIASQCLGTGSDISMLSETPLSRWSDAEISSCQDSQYHGSFQTSPQRGRFKFGAHREEDIFYDVLDMQENLTKLDSTIDSKKTQNLEITPQKSQLRLRRSTFHSISKERLASQCDSQYSFRKCKENCQNSGCKICDCYDDNNVLDRCQYVQNEVKAPFQTEEASSNGKLSDLYNMGSKAQRGRKTLSEKFILDLRNSPGSNIMEEGCFDKAFLGSLHKNDGNYICRTSESGFEVGHYKDMLIIFKFNDAWLPFELKKMITSDLRLLRLLESGLPSWVIFFQSYPIFCQLYCPWMRPLAKTLYILISVVTVLIGFYDLYKNVPVLKVTAARLCGPLFDWIEAWEMISRLKYLGTMLFLQNFEKALKWLLTIIRAVRQLASLLTRPMVEPLVELGEFILPFWSLCIETAEGYRNVIWIGLSSAFSGAVYLMQMLFWPFLVLLSFVWNLVTFILYPIASALWEVLITPIRLVLKLLNSIALISSEIFDFAKRAWQSLSATFQLMSVTESASNTNAIPVWRALWNDLFSQVFRAVRSIVNGFVAFFTACNRHRLSIYNHVAAFLLHLSHALHFRHSADYNTFGHILRIHKAEQDQFQDGVGTEDGHGCKSLDGQNKSLHRHHSD